LLARAGRTAGPALLCRKDRSQGLKPSCAPIPRRLSAGSVFSRRVCGRAVVSPSMADGTLYRGRLSAGSNSLRDERHQGIGCGPERPVAPQDPPPRRSARPTSRLNPDPARRHPSQGALKPFKSPPVQDCGSGRERGAAGAKRASAGPDGSGHAVPVTLMRPREACCFQGIARRSRTASFWC